MNNPSGQARIGAAFKWFGYLCFVIAITVMFYHDSQHLPPQSLGAIFFGIIPGLISWLGGESKEMPKQIDALITSLIGSVVDGLMPNNILSIAVSRQYYF
jgi:hypothetical protein